MMHTTPENQTPEARGVRAAIRRGAEIRGRMFTRIGDRKTLDAQILNAQAAGAIIDEDTDAATVIATAPPPDGRTIFRAVETGDGVWLVSYSRDFYSENA